jgi:hypothetical protein
VAERNKNSNQCEHIKQVGIAKDVGNTKGCEECEKMGAD